MKTQNVILNSSGSDPTIEILIGQAQHGTYRIYLWDENGKNPILIGSGTNWDRIEDCIKLEAAPKLHEKIITWEVIISASQMGHNNYSVNVVFRQGASLVKDGIFKETGSLNGSKFVSGAARLQII